MYFLVLLESFVSILENNKIIIYSAKKNEFVLGNIDQNLTPRPSYEGCGVRQNVQIATFYKTCYTVQLLRVIVV